MSEPTEVLLARIDERTRNMSEKLDTHIQHQAVQSGDHEARLRLIEKINWRRQGVTTLLGSMAGFIVSYVVTLFNSPHG